MIPKDVQEIIDQQSEAYPVWDNDIRPLLKKFAEFGYALRDEQEGWVNEMAQANAAQVLAGYVWKEGVIQEFISAVKVSVKGVTINQTELLKALMNFQQWVYDHQVAPQPSPCI